MRGMNGDDMRQPIDNILDQHDEVSRALRDANTAFDNAMDGLRTAITAVQAPNRAQGEAIDAAIAANQAALRLLNTLPPPAH